MGRAQNQLLCLQEMRLIIFGQNNVGEQEYRAWTHTFTACTTALPDHGPPITKTGNSKQPIHKAIYHEPL